MNTTWRLAASLCGVLILGSATVLAQPNAALARLDGDGDPLPAGARLRLGTKRWRHGREGTSLVWTPDGKQLAFVSEGRIRIVDADTGRLLRAFVPKLPDGTVVPPAGLAISPEGDELLVRSGGRLIAVELATGKHRRTYDVQLMDFGDDGGNVGYSPDGKLVALAESSDYAVLDRRSGEFVIQDDTKAEIQGFRFTRDSSRLVVASLKPSVRVWDLAKREIAARWTFSDEQFVWGPGVSPDGKLVAVGLNHVEVVDPVAGEVKTQLHGDNAKDLFLQLDFTPDGKQLVAASQEGQLYVWRTADWSRQFQLTGDAWVIRSMALRPDGKRVAVGDARNRIWVWSLETGELLFNDRPGHDTEVHAVAFTPDGRTLITAGGARDTHLWSIPSGQHLRSLNTSASSLAFTPDGRQLLTAWYGAPQLRTWDLDTGRQAAEWTAPEPRLRTFALAAEQPLVAMLCDVEAPRGFRLLRRTWPELAAAGDVRKEGWTRGGLAVSPDGRLAAIAPQTSVELVSLPEGETLARLPLPDHWCDKLLFSRDGRFLVSTNSDKSVRVWEVASGQPVHVLTGHERVPAAMAIHPGGRHVATAEELRGVPADHESPLQIRFWDLLAGKQVAALSGHNENVSALAFSPDGQLLAAGMRDTTTLVWDVPAAAQASKPAAQSLPQEDAAALWNELGDADAQRAQAAVLRLLQDPAASLALAEQRLMPAAAVDAAAVQRLLAQLDAEEFKDRAAAYEQLAAFGSTIAPQLRAAVAATDSGEVKLRCGKLLQEAQRRFPQTGAKLGQTRAVQLVEAIGGQRAAALLSQLAGGAAEAHLTQEAKAALARVRR